MDSRQAFMLYACPALGLVVAFAMFVSPLRAVLAVNRKQDMGELNPLPFIAMVANGLGWLAYGLVIHDYFVFCTNISALLLGLFYVMTCSKFCHQRVADQLRNILLAMCCLFVVVSLVYMAAGLDTTGNKTLWGSNAVAILAVYYISPLSCLAKVVRSRDSSSLHRPMLMANIVNGLLWFAYGLATHDWFIIGPNSVGAAFNVISLAISLLLPAKAHQRGSMPHPCGHHSSTHQQQPDMTNGGGAGSEQLGTEPVPHVAASVRLKNVAAMGPPSSTVLLSRGVRTSAFKPPGTAGSADASRDGREQQHQQHDAYADVEAAVPTPQGVKADSSLQGF